MIKKHYGYKRKYVHEVHVNRLFKHVQEKVWLGDRPAMTIAFDFGLKAAIKQTYKANKPMAP